MTSNDTQTTADAENIPPLRPSEAYSHMQSRRAIELKAFLSLVAFFLVLLKGALEVHNSQIHTQTMTTVFTWLSVLIVVVAGCFICCVIQIEVMSYGDLICFNQSETIAVSG